VYKPVGGWDAAHVSVLVNGRPINVWSAHLSVDDAASRVNEVKALQTCAQNWPEARILAGDYNMQQGSPEYMAATQGYGDAWLDAKARGTAINFNGNCDGCTRSTRIDYIFTSSGASSLLMLESVEIFDTRDTHDVTPSDHKPMVATYTVK
jgi:endonuclease/exonuclease/phosphatase family metal-dependent hydrolase